MACPCNQLVAHNCVGVDHIWGADNWPSRLWDVTHLYDFCEAMLRANVSNSRWLLLKILNKLSEHFKLWARQIFVNPQNGNPTLEITEATICEQCSDKTLLCFFATLPSANVRSLCKKKGPTINWRSRYHLAIVERRCRSLRLSSSICYQSYCSIWVFVCGLVFFPFVLQGFFGLCLLTYFIQGKGDIQKEREGGYINAYFKTINKN